jgi:DUF917 family protein
MRTRESPPGNVQGITLGKSVASGGRGAMIPLLQSVLGESPVVDAARVDAVGWREPPVRVALGNCMGQ